MKRPAAKDPKPRMLRLLALSRHGEPGERDAASRALDRMCDQYGITIGELDDEETSVCWFRTKGKLERELIVHVAAMVTDNRELQAWHQRGRSAPIGFELTLSQEAEVSFLFDLYRRALAADLDRFIHAFIIQNEIYPATREETRYPESFPDELRDGVMKTLRMASAATLVSTRKAITKGGWS